MTTTWVTGLTMVIVAYLLGSFPTAQVVARRRGKDIREIGDGNMGSSNVLRNFGIKAGVRVFLVDLFKGTAAILLAQWMELPAVWQFASGTGAVLGHDFPVWARFKGGQGLATTTGVFLGLWPLPGAIGLVIFGLLYLLTHNKDLATALGMVQLLGNTWINGEPPMGLIFIVGLLLFIPLKKWLDKPRREKILAEEAKEQDGLDLNRGDLRDN